MSCKDISSMDIHFYISTQLASDDVKQFLCNCQRNFDLSLYLAVAPINIAHTQIKKKHCFFKSITAWCLFILVKWLKRIKYPWPSFNTFNDAIISVCHTN